MSGIIVIEFSLNFLNFLVKVLLEDISEQKANDLLKRLITLLNSEDILEDLFLEVIKYQGGKKLNIF